LSQTSKALYIFSQLEELWKDLVIDMWDGDFEFQGTWKATYAKKMGVILHETPIQLTGAFVVSQFCDHWLGYASIFCLLEGVLYFFLLLHRFFFGCIVQSLLLCEHFTVRLGLGVQH
jgi:hypothetical protein